MIGVRIGAVEAAAVVGACCGVGMRATTGVGWRSDVAVGAAVEDTGAGASGGAAAVVASGWLASATVVLCGYVAGARGAETGARYTACAGAGAGAVAGAVAGTVAGAGTGAGAGKLGGATAWPVCHRDSGGAPKPGIAVPPGVEEVEEEEEGAWVVPVTG